MSEREQYHQSVIGKGLTEEDERRILEEEKRFFDHPELSIISQNEREMTKIEQAIISLVLEAGDQIDEIYNAPRFPIPPDNFHIIPGERWPEDLGSCSGIFNSHVQQIAIRETPSRLHLAKLAFHELMHLKSFGKLQIVDDSKLVDSRAGFGIVSRDGKKEYFRLFEEAIVEVLTIDFINRHKGHELFAEETKRTNELKERFGNDVIDNEGKAFFDDNLYYAEVLTNQDGSVKLDGQQFTYSKERLGLNLLIEKTVERDQLERYNVSDLQALFVRGHIDGNILPIAKTIDSTFGEGVFRAIGSIEDPDELVSFIESL
ncbi:MAG: hypothetical protein AAB613_02600 [Patescibacteria group bacterium]